jgi:hypothetical protein
MPVDLRCIQCRQRLQVPDELRGHLVRCPKCSTKFTAEEAPPDDDELLAEAERELRSRRWPDQDDEEDEDRFRESAKSRRRRARRTEAVRNLQIPAWLLLLTAVGGGLLMIGWFIFNVLIDLGAFRSLGLEPDPEAGTAEYRAGQVVGFLTGTFITLLWSGLVAAGSVCMLRQRNYPLAVAGCIVAMLPCGCGCLMGMPIGIWGLVALQNRDVKRVFGA